MLVELERDRPSTAPAQEGGYPSLVPSGATPPLKILHVFRAPVGGLFRHVLDLARGQVARAHQVGLILDSTTGGAHAEQALSGIAPQLALGLSRTAMPRFPGPRDFAAVRHVSRRIAAIGPDVVHGHGAKGTAYARLAPVVRSAIRVYTPHGGSLHYSGKPIGLLYLIIERALTARTDLFLFESAFAHDLFCAKVDRPRGLVRVVPNGVAPSEFAPVTPDDRATDIVFIGELRPIKGVDTLIDAVGALRMAGRALSVTIVGDGPDRAQFTAQAEELGLGEAVQFVGPMPARKAFAMGRLLVVPSRAESLPYVVLEAAAAGVPLIATHVGGIPEIFGPQSIRLIAPDDPAALASAIVAALEHRAETQAASRQLQDRVRSDFSLDGMVESVLAGYREALAARIGHW